MESQPVTARAPTPPPALERLALALIPSQARESVAGDLWEMYRSPPQYLADAASAVLFVVLSQASRAANLPVLALQALLLFTALAGVAGGVPAFVATLLVTLLIFVAGAYETPGRPSVRRAIIEAMAAAAAAEFVGMALARLLRPDLYALPYFVFLGPAMVPVLCLVRTLVVLWSDKRLWFRRAQSAEDLRSGFAAFARRADSRNRVESAALVGMALLLYRFPQAAGGAGQWVAIVDLGAALFLTWRGMVRLPDCGPAEFAFRVRTELARQHRIRSLIWWLWFVPLFLVLEAKLRAQATASAPLSLLPALAAALLFGFFIDALNRERRGLVQEEASGLVAQA